MSLPFLRHGVTRGVADSLSHLLLAQVGTPGLVCDEQECIVTCNGAAESLFGRPLHELRGQSLDALMEALEGSRVAVLRGDGGRETAQVQRTPFAGAHGKGALWLLAPEKVEGGQRERIGQLAEFAGEAMLVAGPDRRIQHINTAGYRLLGMPEQQPRELFLDRLFPDWLQGLDPLHQGQNFRAWQGDAILLRPDGEKVPVRQVLMAHFDQGGGWSTLLTLRRDKSRWKEELRRWQHHDVLTGLANRRYLNGLLEATVGMARQQKRRMGVICMDLDHFKDINDTFGHRVGDKVLKALAKRISDTVGQDNLVARSGGDEFTVILPHLRDTEELKFLADRLLQAAHGALREDGAEIKPSLSLGMAVFPEDGQGAESLFAAADIAVRRAKEDGRDTARFFSAEMNRRVRDQVLLESHLRRALAEGEMYLHYQPQACLKTGTIVGVEALARWRHPEWGEVTPDRFIPAAERSGLILELGEWVLRTACRQYRAWCDGGNPPLRLAVNLSPRQFRQHNLATRVEAILAETGVSPRSLELEITEGSLMHDPGRAVAVLQHFSDLGIRVAIDDFGTGYSSLAYLKSFPLDRIKIDRSFVRGVPGDADDMAIIRAILSLARNLGLQTIAEGVETEAQREFLARQGCEEMQGFLLSRPIAGKALRELVLQCNLEGSGQFSSLAAMAPLGRG